MKEKKRERNLTFELTTADVPVRSNSKQDGAFPELSTCCRPRPARIGRLRFQVFSTSASEPSTARPTQQQRITERFDADRDEASVTQLSRIGNYVETTTWRECFTSSSSNSSSSGGDTTITIGLVR